jgi:two-component system OmpR family response regulator
MAAGGKRILVVDDEESICRLIQESLETQGYAVEVAHSSAEAMRKLAGAGYDAAVLDILMPQGDGRFLYQQVQAMKPELAGHVLFITGADFDPALIQFLSASGNRFLKKPFELEDLLRAVRTAASSAGS